METIYQLPTWAETILVICIAIMLAGLAAFVFCKAVTEAIEAESMLEHKRRKSETKALNKWQKLYEEEKANRLNDVTYLINENTKLACENKRLKDLCAKVKVKDL